METKQWVMSETNLLDKDIDSFEDLSSEEREALKIVMKELNGWRYQDVEMVLDAMADDGVYYDITFEPAVGREGIREFGEGWIKAAPDFTPYIEKFIVQGNVVVNMGRIRGTIKGEYFGMPATNKKFDCQFCQVAFVENGKIKYVRDHWNAVDMYNQVGWDINALKE